MKKTASNFAKYSSMGFQMFAIIALGTFGGLKLDQWRKSEFPIFTVCLSVLSVFLAVYYFIRDVIRMGGKDRENK